MSDRNKAFELQERLIENGISDNSLVEFLINNWLSGSHALQAMEAALVEFGLEEEEEEEEEEELEVGMQVEVIDGSTCCNEVGDLGIITEIGGDGLLRVVVEGRINAGNWMRTNQVARVYF